MPEFNEPPIIQRAKVEDKQRLIQTITLAFATDPLVRFASPQADRYLDIFSKIHTHFGGRAFDHGTAWTANDGQAVALWLKPGVEPDSDAMKDLLPLAIPENRMEDMVGVFEGMASYHPDDEHWYLPLIGADPAYLGLGLGSALMKHACLEIDKTGLPAYLESSNPRNISLYERYGFEVMGEILSGAAPVVTPMFRPATT